MRSVNVAKLKKQLSKYLSFAKQGEEIVVRAPENADEQELLLVAQGKMRLAEVQLDVKQVLKIPTGKVSGNQAVEALLAYRDEGL